MFVTTKQKYRININQIRFYEAKLTGGTRIYFMTNGKKCISDTPTEFDALVFAEVEKNRPPYGP